MSKHFISVLQLSESGRGEAGKRVAVHQDCKTVTFPTAHIQPFPPLHKEAVFTFDHVYSNTADIDTLYENSVGGIVESTLLGYHGTVISFGTEGKTALLRDVTNGAICKATGQILHCLKRSKSAANLVVLCSFVVITGENVHDLLYEFPNDVNRAQESVPKLSVVDGNIVGASIHEAKTPSKVAALLKYGSEMEQRILLSYRSNSTHHSLFRVSVEYTQFGSMNAPISGNLWFVDVSVVDPLAYRHSTEEADETYTSLFSFTDVILSLSPTLQEEPVSDLYNKSILTRLLKEALGGNCKTLLICHVPDKPLDHAGVYEAVKVASRARLIQNSPNKRDLAEKALMSAYMKELSRTYGRGWKADPELPSQEERKRNVELAASALAAAVLHTEEEDALGVTAHAKIKLKHSRKAALQTLESASTDVTVDALVAILQDPDRGVPRASTAMLKDVRIRKDVGALFSGSDIVKWMVENVAGVESKEDAQTLGQLLLDTGGIFHSEGSSYVSILLHSHTYLPLLQQVIYELGKVFANAETLFYYARDARSTTKLLSPEEIQALLAQTKKKANLAFDENNQELTAAAISEDVMSHADLLSTSTVDSDTTEEGLCTTDRVQMNVQQRPETQVEEVSTLQDPCDSVHGDDAGEVQDGVSKCSDGGDVQKCDDQSDENTGEPDTDQSDENTGEPDTDQSDENTGEPDTAQLDENTGEPDTAQSDENTGEPDTAPVDSIPTIHTLENTVNYPHPLHMAVAVGKHPGVIRNLVMMFGVDKCDEFGRTPLMFAALGNKRSSCSTLIECGACLDTCDSSGLTALHVACYHGHKESLNVLLNKNASVNISDKMGHSALHWSAVPNNRACLQLLLSRASSGLVHQTDRNNLTAMHWVIYFDHPEHLRLLLKRYEDPLELDSVGRTFMTYGIEKQATNCIKALLSLCPALLVQPDINGCTPLHHASAHDHPVYLQMLLTHALPKGATSIDINCTDKYLRTPLHCAVHCHRLQNAMVLVGNGALLDAVDVQGRTPLDYAMVLESDSRMVTLLQGNTTAMDSKELPTLIQASEPHSPNSKVCCIL